MRGFLSTRFHQSGQVSGRAIHAGPEGGIGDFNGDGKADIVWRYDTAGGINVWFFDGARVTGDGWLPTVSDPLWQIVGPK
jgi:prepilin-type processing-associated H-X9-DG protein